MYNLYKKLSMFFFNKHISKENVIFNLFEFLKTEIPFLKIQCATIVRKEKVYKVFIEYNNVKISRSSYRSRLVIDTNDDVLKVFGSKLNKASIINKDNYTENFNEKNLEEFLKVCSSAIVLCLDSDEELDTLTTMTLLTDEPHSFTQSHSSILEELYPILSDLIVTYHKEEPNAYLEIEASGPLPKTYEEQLGQCPDMAPIFKKIKSVAPFDATVLIQGETGTGKELIAGSIHALSKRYNKPFVHVNCGAIPDSLLESELFGYEKGSFTGANQAHKGYFEQANYGTIFLDEIGELSQNAQIKLLHVLENQKIQRIGSEKSIQLDIRIIAATHRNLASMVKKGMFREDLFYRLKVFPLEILPLRQRPADLIVLIKYFFNLYAKKFDIENASRISKDDIELLSAYSWPGNIRELRHTIESALLNFACNNGSLDFSFILSDLTDDTGSRIKQRTPKVKKFSKQEIERALQQANGKIQGKNSASEILGINHTTLRSRMENLKIDYKKNRRQC